MKLKLRAVGKSTALALPKKALHRLHVKTNDFVNLFEVPGGYLLTAYNADLGEQVRRGLEFMKKYKGTFSALAK